jgi:hypothetical protein
MQQKTAGKFLEQYYMHVYIYTPAERAPRRIRRPDARCSMYRGGQLAFAELQPTADKMYDRN